eukprot:2155755-Rhodomonas_salina.1
MMSRAVAGLGRLCVDADQRLASSMGAVRIEDQICNGGRAERERFESTRRRPLDSFHEWGRATNYPISQIKHCACATSAATCSEFGEAV